MNAIAKFKKKPATKQHGLEQPNLCSNGFGLR
jgi:hypothetical protein